MTKPIQLDLLLEKIGQQLGIEWETASTKSVGSRNVRSFTEDDGLVVVPSPEEMEGLYELAMLGDMLKIERWATELEDRDQIYRNFAAKLRELAGGFKTKAILTLVEQYRGDGNAC